MTALQRFARDHSMPHHTAAKMRRLAENAGRANVAASNGDPHPMNPDPTDKNENARLWSDDLDTITDTLLTIAVAHGFAGIEYNGLYPTLIKNGRPAHDFPIRTGH